MPSIWTARGRCDAHRANSSLGATLPAPSVTLFPVEKIRTRGTVRGQSTTGSSTATRTLYAERDRLRRSLINVIASYRGRDGTVYRTHPLNDQRASPVSAGVSPSGSDIVAPSQRIS
jgi:hypothetical protein